MDKIKVEVMKFKRNYDAPISEQRGKLEEERQGELIAITSDADAGIAYTVIFDDGLIEQVYPDRCVEVYEVRDENNHTDTLPHFTKLRERFPILTDDEIVAAALNFYEMHTSDREG